LGALLGHLAYSEMTSVVGMRKYVAGVKRLTGDSSAAEFFEVHVDIDDHHGDLAVDSLVGSAVRHNPGLIPDVLFGVRALTELSIRFAETLTSAWQRGASSLYYGPVERAMSQSPPRRPENG
jgi:hypothetical protein